MKPVMSMNKIMKRIAVMACILALLVGTATVALAGSRSMGTISLKAGENVIRLTVNNTEKQFATGTMDAAAPLVDCICIYAGAELSMEEYDN